jgi:hypothetical protein
MPHPPHSSSLIHFSVLGSCQKIHFSLRLHDMVRNKSEVLRWGLLALHPTPKLEDHPVGWPRLLIQCICSCLPYLEAISSIHKLSARHFVVTGDPLNVDNFCYVLVIIYRCLLASIDTS